jgi:hypothetical protein
MKKIKIILIVVLMGTLGSCKKYLDVIPDDVPTIDHAFSLRTSAEKFLYTCYSYMPETGSYATNPAFHTVDEVWNPDPQIDINANMFNIAKGLQNNTNPFADYWTGGGSGKKLWQGIRDCNIFLENIDKTPELEDWEKERWKAEVLFLKAYYHFFLFRMYGPIPIVRKNLPLGATPDEVKVYREPVDEVVKYIVELLDESAAMVDMPDVLVGTELTELGRITRSIVLSFKARVLVTAASPLFNGNPEYAGFRDKRGVLLFDPNYSTQKWSDAVDACKTAIDFLHAKNFKLYHFVAPTSYVINDTIQRELDLRCAISDKERNTEMIWVNTSSTATDIQRMAMPLLAPGTSGSGPKGLLAPPISFVSKFYTKNGVPINEDKTWDFNGKYNLREAGFDHLFYIGKGERTIKFHFDRQPRCYALLGFDRGVVYGNCINNYNKASLFYVKGRKSETAARQGISNYSITGYTVKKLVKIETQAAADGNVTGNNQAAYPWPEMRLSDLYLMYSEALNELNGYSPEATHWINLVRERAGLGTIEDSWRLYSTNPSKYTTKDGLREIIQQERTIELAFEGQRFWDLRRWKKAHVELNQVIRGWDITQQEPEAYYREVVLWNQRFGVKDYLMPIKLTELQTNNHLTQNPGW